MKHYEYFKKIRKEDPKRFWKEDAKKDITDRNPQWCDNCSCKFNLYHDRGLSCCGLLITTEKYKKEYRDMLDKYNAVEKCIDCPFYSQYYDFDFKKGIFIKGEKNNG